MVESKWYYPLAGTDNQSQFVITNVAALSPGDLKPEIGKILRSLYEKESEIR